MTDPKTMKLEDGRYASWETFICDVAKACDLPGFGENALQSTDGTWYPFNDASDYFLKAFANVAYGDEDDPVADITAEEAHMQALDELPEEWKSAVTTEEWPKVLQLISRGGRTGRAKDVFDDEGRDTYRSPYMVNLYSEARAAWTNCYTGEHSPGAIGWRPERFADLTPIEEVYSREEFPFRHCSFKGRFRSTSMGSNSPILRELCPHNYVEMNVLDAQELGIEDGDEVVVSNPTGDVMTGVAMVRSGTARGTFATAYGYWKYAYGATDVTIGDTTISGNPDIGAGICVSQMLDPTVSDGAIVPAIDAEAATPGRNGGMFKIEKAEG